MVIWSEPAKADPRSIHDFIARDSSHYAKKVTEDIAAKTDILDDLPRMGRVVPELNNEHIRELSLRRRCGEAVGGVGSGLQRR